jgi:hypothetical protein
MDEQIIRDAWNTAKLEHQPDYDALIPEYKANLQARAEQVYATKYPIGDGTLQAFDQQISDYDRRQEEAKNAEAAAPDKEGIIWDDSATKPKQGKLPKSFPHQDLLEAADITTYAQARALEGDYSSVKGIGPAKGKEVDAALGEANG